MAANELSMQFFAFNLRSHKFIFFRQSATKLVGPNGVLYVSSSSWWYVVTWWGTRARPFPRSRLAANCKSETTLELRPRMEISKVWHLALCGRNYWKMQEMSRCAMWWWKTRKTNLISATRPCFDRNKAALYLISSALPLRLPSFSSLSSWFSSQIWNFEPPNP